MRAKRNLLWGFLFIFLFLAAYFIEEKKIFQKTSSEDGLQNLVFSRDNLQSLHLPYSQLLFHHKEIVVGVEKIPADPKRTQDFLEILSSLKVKRVLDMADMEVLDQQLLMGEVPVRFSVFLKQGGEVKFALGRSLPNSSDFYLELKTQNTSQILVVEDVSPYPQLYSPGQQDLRLRFERLLSFINADAHFFYHARPFANLDIQKVITHWEGGPTQEIQATPLFLVPAPIGGLAINEEKMKSYIRDLQSIEAKASFPKRIGFVAAHLGEKLAALEISTSAHEHQLFFIHSHQTNPQLLWLEEKVTNSYYLLSQNQLEQLMPTRDFFWLKKPAGRELGEITTEKRAKVQVSSGPWREVTIPEGDLQNQELKILLQSLLGLPPVGEAFRVSDLNQQRIDDFNRKTNGLKLVIDNQEFWFDPAAEEIRILKPSSKLVFHYLHGQFPMIKWSQEAMSQALGILP